MAKSKQDGVGAISQADTAVEVVATPQLQLICDDCNIEGDNQTIDQKNSVTPDRIGVLAVGSDYSFSISGMEPSVTAAGYLFYLALGGCTGASTTHTIVPADASQYCNIFVDRKADISSGGTGETTEQLLGARIGSLELEVSSRQYASMSISGIGCALGTPVTSLTASLPSGANHRPLSWNTLRAGSFAIGYDNASPSADTTITGLKLAYGRSNKPEDLTLVDDTPDSIVEGPRTLDYEITRVFDGANARSEYNAWLGQQHVEINVNWAVGTYSLNIAIPHATITGPLADPVGIGEDSIKGTLKCRAYQDTAALITVTAIDGVTGIYP